MGAAARAMSPGSINPTETFSAKHGIRMIQVPDELRCLFSASVDRQGDSYRIEVPENEVEKGDLRLDETYRVVLLSTDEQTSGAEPQQPSAPTDEEGRTPPVEEGDRRDVTIETLGDQGDGIVTVERGYVVIVPGARPDDEVTIEIENVRANLAFASVVDDSSTDRREQEQDDRRMT